MSKKIIIKLNGRERTRDAKAGKNWNILTDFLPKTIDHFKQQKHSQRKF